MRKGLFEDLAEKSECLASEEAVTGRCGGAVCHAEVGVTSSGAYPQQRWQLQRHSWTPLQPPWLFSAAPQGRYRTGGSLPTPPR